MKTNQKGFVNIMVIVVVLVLIVGGGYFIWSKKSIPVATTPVTSKVYSETEILASLKTDWSSIQSAVLIDIQPRSGDTEAKIEHLKKIFTAPAAVQFIGNNNLLIRVNDMEADWTAVFNYDGSKLNFIETAWEEGGGTTLLPQSEWQKLISKYGDPSYSVSSYNNTGTYTSLTPGFEYLVKVPENIFINGKSTSVGADPIANWKIYTNIKYGFEIKIPQDWTVESGNSQGGGGLTFYSQASRIKNLAKVEECKNKPNSGMVPCVSVISDMVFANANYSYTDTKQETINGVVWEAIGGTYTYLAYQTKQGENLFYFSVVGFPENKEKLVKILSTFKFTK